MSGSSDDATVENCVGPTRERRYRSLEAALLDQRTPLANRAFIRGLLAHLPIAEYLDRGSYIKAVRQDGGPAIEVHFGYSNGFRSEDEIVAGAGDVDRWRSDRGTGLWGVTHPENRIGAGSGPSRAQRDYGLCDSWWRSLPASGICPYCTE